LLLPPPLMMPFRFFTYLRLFSTPFSFATKAESFHLFSLHDFVSAGMWPALSLLAGETLNTSQKLIAHDAELVTHVQWFAAWKGDCSHTFETWACGYTKCSLIALHMHFSFPIYHSIFVVLDPLHLDSADDLKFGSTVDGVEGHASDAGYSGGSYQSVFGPDVNIEYAGLKFFLFSPFSRS
jgi:hypothetical protein